MPELEVHAKRKRNMCGYVQTSKNVFNIVSLWEKPAEKIFIVEIFLFASLRVDCTEVIDPWVNSFGRGSGGE